MPCSRSSALQHFERGNAVEIRKGVMFNFYAGLPHVHLQCSIIFYQSIKATIKGHVPKHLYNVPSFSAKAIIMSTMHAHTYSVSVVSVRVDPFTVSMM